MDEFDRRWQCCARLARAESGNQAQVPAGFATRVWARSLIDAGNSLPSLWVSWSFTALVLASAALAVCGVSEYYAGPSENIWTPHLEDAVTAVWRTP